MGNYLLKNGCVLQIFGIPVEITSDVVISTNNDLSKFYDNENFELMKKIFIIENDKITKSIASKINPSYSDTKNLISDYFKKK